jgi:hypothetical protein
MASESHMTEVRPRGHMRRLGGPEAWRARMASRLACPALRPLDRRMSWCAPGTSPCTSGSRSLAILRRCDPFAVGNEDVAGECTA